MTLGFYFNTDTAPLSHRRHTESESESESDQTKLNAEDSVRSNCCGLFLYVAICELLGVVVA